MSIKQLNMKIVGGLIVYWLLVCLLGFFLLTSGGMGFGGGNGNGNGFGNGGGGAGGTSGTGMTEDQSAKGSGSEEEGEIPAGGEPESKAEEQTTSAGANTGTAEEEGEVENGSGEQDSDSTGAEDGVKTAQKELEDTKKRNTPKLFGEEMQKSEETDNSPQSKVIGLDEAKKGFFGVEASGRATTLFLLDISTSMESPTSEGPSRLELLKKILINELDRLHRAARKAELKSRVGSFVLATFSGNLNVYPQNGSYSYDSAQAIDASKQFINNLHTDLGGTQMMNAWQTLAPSLVRQHGCDVVFFLSDGEPTDCTEQELLNFLGHNLPGLPINTFSLGTQSSLMQNIAKTHRGKYREIR